MAVRNVNQKRIEKIEPRKKRIYTDIICLIASIIFFKILFDIAVIGLLKGSPSNLAIPYDPDR